MIRVNTSSVAHSVVSGLHDGKHSVTGGTVLTHIQLGNKSWQFVDFWHIPPGASIGNHRHDTGYECYFVISGQGSMMTNDVYFIINKGDMILNEPGDNHSLENTSAEDLVVLVTAVIEE